jgi:hypothetical protein
METSLPAAAPPCGYCGRPIAADPAAPQRFGERFCSERHADEFAAGVRAAKIQAAVRREDADALPAETDGTCALPPAGQRGWRDSLKRAACWGAPVLLLLAIPLVWSGGWVAAGGSLLSVLALLACPLGMYFMMRSMTSMQHQHGATEAERGKEDHRV